MHCDLTPGNSPVADDQEPRVLEFELAAWYDGFPRTLPRIDRRQADTQVNDPP